MSRFSNPNATKRFVLPGPCECPGKPHDEDFLLLRSEFGADDLVFLEEETNPKERMKFLVKGWNLLDHDGSAAEIDDDHLGRLYLDMFPAIDAWMTDNIKSSTLPNASGAPSRNGTKASASRTRTTRKST